MRTGLKVPFAEKDETKKLGARWDATKKVWYIQNVDDMRPFSRWLDVTTVGSDSGATAPKKSVTKKAAPSEGITTVGSSYKEAPRVCECLPWDVCGECRSTAINLDR